jgi:hypothetical protein
MALTECGACHSSHKPPTFHKLTQVVEAEEVEEAEGVDAASDRAARLS